MNHDMEEKGIIAPIVSRLSPASRCQGTTASALHAAGGVVPKRCPLPRHWAPSSESPAGDNHGFRGAKGYGMTLPH
ncbi:unnamed protein product [Boreogadus saida]